MQLQRTMPGWFTKAVKWTSVLLAACVAFNAGSLCHAKSTTLSDTQFMLAPGADIPVVMLSVAAIFMPMALNTAWVDPPERAARDRQSVNAFDRISTRHLSAAANSASNWVVGSAIAMPFAWSALDALHRPIRGPLIEAVLVSESILVTIGITHIIKAAVRRDRPYIYNPSAPDALRNSSDAHRSFFSAHTSETAAALVSFAAIQWQDRPGTPAAWLAIGAAVVAIPTVGALRISAGRHYPTDVLAGAAVGTGIGLLVPWLHRRDTTENQSPSSISIAPIGVSGHPGFTLSAGF